MRAETSCQSRSKFGVSASSTALPGPAGAQPQPSRMTRRYEGMLAPARQIAMKDSSSSDAPPTSAPSTSGWREELRGVVRLDRAAVEHRDVEHAT